MDKKPNPKRVEAGKKAAASRWGEMPRSVRLDGLTDAQRRLVLATIETQREVNEVIRLETLPPEVQRAVLALIRANDAAE
jgi:ribosomal protein L15E